MLKLIAASVIIASTLVASVASADAVTVKGALIVFAPEQIVGSVKVATTVHGNMHCSRMVDNLVGGQNSVCTVSK